MPTPRKLPEIWELREMIRRGMTYQEIGDGCGASRQAVHLALAAAGATRSRISYREFLPWSLTPEDGNAFEAKMLKLFARSRLGLPLTPQAARRLDAFCTRCDELDVVVDYRPDHPQGPFVYVPRRPSDVGYARRPGGAVDVPRQPTRVRSPASRRARTRV